MYLYRVIFNLVVDIGNTRCKTAVFSGDEMLEFNAAPFTLKYIEELLIKYPDSRRIVSSVVTLSDLELDFFKKHQFVTVKDCKTAPVRSIYQTHETLGDDRWAGVCGAACISQNNFPFLVVQIGTAITFDYVDEQGRYIGGAISPGISLRFRALHNFTGKLPLIMPENKFEEMGLSTKDSILSGVMNGCLAEIKFRTDKFIKTNNESSVFIGGGDAGYFDFSHENLIFAVPNIVVVGLNHLLNLNP